MTHSHVSIAISLLFISSALIGIFKMLIQVFRSAPVEVFFRFLSRKTESKAMKQKQELIRRKQTQEKRLAEQERIRKHCEYKNEIRLNIVLKDRHFLFGSKYDHDWDCDPQKYFVMSHLGRSRSILKLKSKDIFVNDVKSRLLKELMVLK